MLRRSLQKCSKTFSGRAAEFAISLAETRQRGFMLFDREEPV